MSTGNSGQTVLLCEGRCLCLDKQSFNSFSRNATIGLAVCEIVSHTHLFVSNYRLRPDCKNSPQSHIVIVYDAGHDKSDVFHSAEWYDGDWSNDGIREAWLWCFIWVECFGDF
ncbi:hypothetical protein TNCV_3084491 [Trichonephila clavipes]|nr:hypothetical protein TNCV_3084491 [Trichonephila clavipes]